jgi:hypothetical protein
LTGGTLYASTDGGATFSARTASLPDGSLKAVGGLPGDLWIAAGDSGLLQSTDGGARFTRITTVKTAQGVGFGKAAPGARYQAIYLAGTVGRVFGVFRSTDEGLTWRRLNDDRHRFGYLGTIITGDPNLYGRVYIASNGRGVIYGTPR